MTRTAPLRLLALWTMALIVAVAIAASSARGMTLGEASLLSAPGQPLRVAIPVAAAPREALNSNCINLIRTAGDGLGDVVTAKVSLERAAAAPRLLVSTAQAPYEPVLRISIEAGCQNPVRRSYALLLDPAATPAATAEDSAPRARAPGQERLAAFVPAAARRDPPDSSGIGAATYAQRPVGMGSGPRLTPAVLQYADAPDRGNLRQVASVAETVPVAPPPRAEPLASERRNDTWWTIAIAISGFVAIVLGAILVRHGRAAPRGTAWSNANARTRTRAGPRSVGASSAAIATLSHASTPSSSLLSRAAPTTRAWVAPPAAAVTLPNLATAAKERSLTRSTVSKPLPSAQRDDVVDSLLNEIEGDLNVETAVRRVHAAAAASGFSSDVGSEAILKAIEAAERDFMLVSPPPAEAALGRALDDELLGKRRPVDKAA